LELDDSSMYADWWNQGLITDDDFVKGIQYLVEQGIISV